MRAHDVNLYINFAINAIMGRLHDADVLVKLYGDSIRAVATALTEARPFAPRPIYRGMLLDPAQPVKADPTYTFLSWSEDRDVARWFATPDSVISSYVTEQKPHLRGFVFELERAPHVLFHYSWAGVFGRPLEQFALMHPEMGIDGYHQIQWSLHTQREVITEPLATLPEAKPIESVAGVARAALDARLAPPWWEGA